MIDALLQQNILEMIVLVGIAIVVFGLFWKVILIGAGLLFCVMVLANHVPKVESAPIVYTTKQEQIIESVVPVIKEIPKVIDPRRAEYVGDCVRYGFSKQWCEDNWDDKN